MSATHTHDKSWRALEAEIVETFRKWDGYHVPCIESPFSSLRGDLTRATAAEQRKASRAGQSAEERAVTLNFSDTNGQRYSATATKSPRAIDNLHRLAVAVEMMRMANVRDVALIMAILYRQMHPAPAKHTQQQEQPKAPPSSSGPYATLHVANDAPLEVAEAAYRALVKSAHPDWGGENTRMVALNAAIASIRTERKVSK